MPRGPTGLIAKLDLPGSASCIAWIDHDDLTVSLRTESTKAKERERRKTLSPTQGRI